MTAFEIYLNGRKTCTAGLGQAGVVISSLIWASGGPQDLRRDDLEFRVGGYVSRTATHLSWCNRRLKSGDEIKVVVVKSAKADRPKTRRVESEATRTRREREYVEKKAAEFGWTITK